VATSKAATSQAGKCTRHEEQCEADSQC